MQIKNMFNRKNIFLVFGYLILFIPMMFSMFYSVPLGDDFAFGSSTVSDNLFINACGYVAWNWMNWSGRWLTFFIQKMTIPLNVHVHLGHIYGIIQILLFLVFSFILIYSIRQLVILFTQDVSAKCDIVTYIIVAVLYSTNYYSEVFNWYIGATAYALPMVLMLLTYVFIAKYFITFEKKYFVGMIIAGIYPAVNEMFDVALGIFYLYVLFISYKKNGKRILTVKNIIPLLVYILLGMSNVFAPGNTARSNYYQIDVSLFKGVKWTIIDIVVRVQDVIVDHPLTVVLFVLLFIIGIYINKDKKEVTGFLPLIITMAIAVFGCLFPYVYARGFSTTYVDVRMEYVVEYLTLLSICFICIKFGSWCVYRFNLVLTSTFGLLLTLGMCLFTYVSVVQSYSYLDVVQIDILRNKGLIVESYNFWDGVLTEIEESTEDDVVIYRDTELDWTPYFLYTGLTDGDVFDVSADTIYDKEWIMPNVYYGKNSIQLIYTDTAESGDE